jgi:hypothetical protein
LPVSLALAVGFRLVWVCAKLGNRSAIGVQRALWDAGLNVPALTAVQKQEIAR